MWIRTNNNNEILEEITNLNRFLSNVENPESLTKNQLKNKYNIVKIDKPVFDSNTQQLGGILYNNISKSFEYEIKTIEAITPISQVSIANAEVLKERILVDYHMGTAYTVYGTLKLNVSSSTTLYINTFNLYNNLKVYHSSIFIGGKYLQTKDIDVDINGIISMPIDKLNNVFVDFSITLNK